MTDLRLYTVARLLHEVAANDETLEASETAGLAMIIDDVLISGGDKNESKRKEITGAGYDGTALFCRFTGCGGQDRD